MANEVDISQKSTKLSIWWRKFTSIFEKKAILIGAVLILIGVALLAFKFIHKTPHERASDMTREAAQQAEKGSFNDAIQTLLKAYDTETKPAVKAGIAYKLGIKYYQTGSSEEGKKWLNKAAEGYKSAGDAESAESAKKQIETQEGAKKAGDVNTEIYDQNAARRGNIQDDQL